MPRVDKLADAEIAQHLADLAHSDPDRRSSDGWTLDSGKLRREFQFEDFNEAFGFMTRVALVAEQMNHHPEWSNVWNRVLVHLQTHDAGGLSRLDFELAAAMDRIASS